MKSKNIIPWMIQSVCCPWELFPCKDQLQQQENEKHIWEKRCSPLFLVCKWQLYWYTVLCTYRSSETHRRKIKWSLWMSSVVTFLQSSLLCSQYLLNLSISRRCRAMAMLTQIVGVHWIMNRLLLQILPGFCAIH